MKIFFYFFSLISLSAFAQKEHSKWYFGWKAALDFATGSPLAINTSSMVSGEGCVSTADTSGNLLFYSNGSIIWNKNDTIMSNGNGLMGNPSTAQSSFVVKKPGTNSNLYYLFTLGELGTGSLGYSIIDMALAAGLGSVITKNDTLAKNMTEKLHGTLHCNGIDFWVVGHKYNSNEFYAYLVTAAGINTVPVVSAVGLPHAVINGTVNGSGGAMKFSPNGKKLAVANAGAQTIELLNFDPATGQVSNGLLLSTNYSSFPYGCEFSPDGSKLYITGAKVPICQLDQWDLCAGSNSDIINSQQLIASLTLSVVGTFGAAQLAPDGKIYVASIKPGFISAINNPNAAGTACNFIVHGVPLTPNFSGSYRGLPNHISSAHRQKAQINTAVTGSCGTVSFSYTPPPYLCAQASESVSSIEWRFNDSASATSNTSSVNNPQHVYSENGTYTVTLLVRYSCYTDTLKQVVSVSDFPNLTVSGKQTICAGEKVEFTFGGASSYSLNGLTSAASYTAQPSANTVYTISATGTGTAACVAHKTISLSVLPCAGIAPISNQASNIRIYPNPSSGMFTIETESNTDINVTDLSGRSVLYRSLNSGKNNLDLSHLAEGVYFAETKAANQTITFKLIKE